MQLGCVLVAWAFWYRDPSAGRCIPIAAAPLLLRALSARSPVRRTPLDLGLVAFVLTAAMGVWAAYDRPGSQAVWPKLTPVGWQALWGLVLAVLLFYALVNISSETGQRWLMALSAGSGAAGAIWFAAGQDWVQEPAKVRAVTRLALALQALLPRLPGEWLNTNIVAGVLAVLIPSSLGLALGGLPGECRAPWAWRACGWVTAVLTGLGILLTTSRGAWLAVAVSLALAATWWWAGRGVRGRQQLLYAAAAVALVLAVSGLALALWPGLCARVCEYAAITDRAGIFREALLLVRDYPITGFGLGEFALQHSTYVLLIHVPIHAYAHSLYLDVALGKGVVGLLAALSVLVGALALGLWTLCRAQRPSPVLRAGLLSLVVMLVHGTVDDPVYIGRAMPLLWMPVGLVVAGTQDLRLSLGAALRAGIGWTLAAVGLLLVLGCALWRPLRALWLANLGAVRQAQIELSVYDYAHDADLSLDEIRQRENLAGATYRYQHSLALRGDQVTARTRLAAIALSRGQYEQALGHAQAVWGAGHRDRVTRLLLGDALIATGDPEGALEVVRGLEWVDMRLRMLALERYESTEQYRRAADAWRVVVGLNPGDGRARRQLAQAEEQAAGQ